MTPSNEQVKRVSAESFSLLVQFNNNEVLRRMATPKEI